MMSKTVARFKELWPSIPLELVDLEDKENPQQGICKKFPSDNLKPLLLNPL